MGKIGNENESQQILINDILSYLEDYGDITVINTTKDADEKNVVYSIIFRNGEAEGLYTFTMTFGDLKKVELR